MSSSDNTTPRRALPGPVTGPAPLDPALIPASSPPSVVFQGVPNSNVFGTPVSTRGNQRRRSLSNSTDPSAFFGRVQRATAGPSTAPLSSDRRRRSDKMTSTQVIRLLRFLIQENLSIVALLSALFSDDPPPPYPSSYPPTDHSPHSSVASRRSIAPRFLHERARGWLRSKAPGKVARQWTGMEEFAAEHVENLVRGEVRQAIKAEKLRGPVRVPAVDSNRHTIQTWYWTVSRVYHSQLR
ncbi:hypothetical protein V8E36_002810 [Tilletia maclaganii]